MRFRLASHLYAGKCNDDIIILDLEKNRYLSITDKASITLQAALENEFVFEKGKYKCTTLDNEKVGIESDMIVHFLSKQFIVVCDQSEANTTLKKALLPGGLADYRWDYKDSMTSLSSAPKIAILKALVSLIRIELAIKKDGIKGVVIALEKAYAQTKIYSIPTDRQLQELSVSVDIACALYPKKIVCLGWAATFTFLALKKGFLAHLVIGVQNMPFYAHAWTEVDGQVINDDYKVSKYLTPILIFPSRRS